MDNEHHGSIRERHNTAGLSLYPLYVILRKSIGGSSPRDDLQDGYSRITLKSPTQNSLENCHVNYKERGTPQDSEANRHEPSSTPWPSKSDHHLDGRLAALAADEPETHSEELSHSLRNSGLRRGQRTAILIEACEAAVEGTLEDGLLTLDEKNDLCRYLDHFGITTSQVNDSGVHTSVVQAAVTREIAKGVVPPVPEHPGPDSFQPHEVGT